MAYLWTIPNKSSNNNLYCLNLNQIEEELFIIGYKIATLYGKYNENWMMNIEKQFFNRSNALSLYDLCNLNYWLENTYEYSDICLIPYSTKNPSSGPQDRVIFSQRRDLFLSKINKLSKKELYDLAMERVNIINKRYDYIQVDSDKDVSLIYNKINKEIYQKDTLDTLETNSENIFPELVEQDDFVILSNQANINNEISNKINQAILLLEEIQLIIKIDEITKSITLLKKI